MFGIVIDKKTGLVLDRCVIIEDYESKETEEVIPYEYSLGNPVGAMNKPRWTGREWIDTDPIPPIAPEPQEPSEMEVLKSQLDELSEYTLLIEMKNIELEEQTTLNSEYALDLDTRLTMLENKQI